jgi:Na+-driven multidrug efflux pump
VTDGVDLIDRSDNAKLGVRQGLHNECDRLVVVGDLGFVEVLVFAGALKGIRRSGIMMVLNMAGVCLPRIIWVLFVFPMLGTPTVLYMIYPISYAISAVPLGIAYSRCLNQRIKEHGQTSPVKT